MTTRAANDAGRRGAVGWLGAWVAATIACSGVDVASTRAATPHVPPDVELPLQALLAWACAATLALPFAVLLARLFGSRLAATLACTALPVAAHAVLREPLRRPDGLASVTTWLGLAAVLAGAAAVLVLAAWLDRRAARGVRRASLGAAALLAVVALLPLGGTPEEAPASRRAAPFPNVLLLVWDTTRAMSLGPYGYDAETTPHLAELAARGTVFERAFSASVFTLSSHTSLLTGLPPSLHGTGMRRQTVTQTTLAELLGRLGYRTGAFVGTSVLAAGRGLEDGFDVYDDRVDPRVCDTHLWALVHDIQVVLADAVPALRGNGLPHWFQDFQRPAAEVLDRTLAFVERDDPRPWFAFVNLFDVHWPYLPGDAARERHVADYDGPLDGYLFRSDRFEPDYELTPDDVAHVRALYDAEMWELDRAVNAFLERLGLESEDTIVVLTSDHGEGFGEREGREAWSHEALHAPQTEVPLIVFAPGRAPEGARVAAPASGVDVVPTVLGLLGVEAPEDLPLAGVDLFADVGGTPAVAARPGPIVIEDHDNVDPAYDADAVIQDGFKLLKRGDHVTLHEIATDPLDEHDVAAEHPELVAELLAFLETLHEARAADEGGVENLDALRALGYFGEDGGH